MHHSFWIYALICLHLPFPSHYNGFLQVCALHYVNTVSKLSYHSLFFLQLHLGVNSGASRFAIEHQAYNEATFCCPDELGWKPKVRVSIYLSIYLIGWVEEFSLVGLTIYLTASLIFCYYFHLLQRVPIVPEDGQISRVREVSWNFTSIFFLCFIFTIDYHFF